jgi:hypothetical protein
MRLREARHGNDGPVRVDDWRIYVDDRKAGEQTIES